MFLLLYLQRCFYNFERSAKTLHTLDSSIRIMFNYLMTFTTFRNWFLLVFVQIHYCILYTQIYNSAISLYTVSVFLNIFLVKNEVVIADRLVVSRMLNKFIPLLLLSHIWLIYWVTANGRSADTHVFSPGGFSHNWQLTNVWTLTHVWRRDKNRNIKEGGKCDPMFVCVSIHKINPKWQVDWVIATSYGDI